LHGGQVSGVVVAAASQAAIDQLKLGRLTLAAGGRLYDRGRRQYVSGVTVVDRLDEKAAPADDVVETPAVEVAPEPVVEEKPAPKKRAPRKRPSTNVALRETELPEHKPAKPRPPRATVPTTKRTRRSAKAADATTA
jgi:hypothetical protein